VYKSINELDKEITRLSSILEKGPVKGKLWTPHLLKLHVCALRSERRKFIYPIFFRIKAALSRFFLKLSHFFD